MRRGSEPIIRGKVESVDCVTQPTDTFMGARLGDDAAQQAAAGEFVLSCLTQQLVM
jgi:hypothetical protein